MKDLLKLAQLGDGDAFARLFQEHAQMLWKTAVSVMGNEDEAADMLQETAVKAWMSIPKFDGKSKLSTWLIRILLNRCFDELRSRKKAIPYAEMPCPEDAQGAFRAIQSQAEDGISRQNDRMDIDSAMSRLRRNDRLILTLFYVNDMPISEIASALGIAEGAVRTRLARARTRFKQVYTKNDPAGASSGGSVGAAVTEAII